MVYTVACIYFVAIWCTLYGFGIILRGLRDAPEEQRFLLRAIPCIMGGSVLLLCVSAFCSLWKMMH